MLLSDGVLINADDYVSGLDGFIVAHWYGEHNDSLELEVPNSCLTEDHAIMKWDPKVNKKPAAPMKSDPDEKEAVEEKNDDEEQGEAAEEEEEAASLQLKLRSGHGNKMTIVVQSTSKDKAQILEVTGAQMAGKGISPHDMCKEVAKQLQLHLKDLDPPAAGADWLAPLRHHARNYNNEMLGRLG